MLLRDLAGSPHIVRSRLFRDDFDLKDFSSDSREAGPATAFFALEGLVEDGHGYLDAALAAGAPALFVSEPGAFERLAARAAAAPMASGAAGAPAEPGAGLAGILQVAPGRGSLADIAALIYGDPSSHLNLLGITGTNGKTTVSHLVGQLYEGLGKGCGVIGSLGAFLNGEAVAGERTTPEAPALQAFLRNCREQGVRNAAMEATSIGIALERTRHLHFRAAAFTNLTQDHLDFHGTMAAYAESKLRLFFDHDTKSAVVNSDDPLGSTLAERMGRERPAIPVLTYGFNQGADLRLEEVRLEAGGSQATLCMGDGRYPLRTALLGRFNLYNLLAAIGLLLAAGENLAEVLAACAGCRGVAGRFEEVPLAGAFTVVVDYAHTPDALENALATARQLTAETLTVVFGCGGERDAAKRPLMGGIAERLADEVVITSDNPRGEDPERIMADIQEGLTRTGAVALADRKAAIRHALENAGAGDLVLIAGKGHEAYQEVAGEKRPFDDREIVAAWAKKTGNHPKGG